MRRKESPNRALIQPAQFNDHFNAHLTIFTVNRLRAGPDRTFRHHTHQLVETHLMTKDMIELPLRRSDVDHQRRQNAAFTRQHFIYDFNPKLSYKKCRVGWFFVSNWAVGLVGQQLFDGTLEGWLFAFRIQRHDTTWNAVWWGRGMDWVFEGMKGRTGLFSNVRDLEWKGQ